MSHFNNDSPSHVNKDSEKSYPFHHNLKLIISFNAYHYIRIVKTSCGDIATVGKMLYAPSSSSSLIVLLDTGLTLKTPTFEFDRPLDIGLCPKHEES